MSKQINLPIGWCLSNIEEICFLKARIGWQGLRSDEFLDYGYFCLITGTDIIEGEINWADTYYITSERYNQDKTIQLRIGDILITKDGTIGKVGYVDTLPKPATLNSGVYVVRSKDEKSILNQYLARFFKSLFFENFIGELKAGSTISHLYQKDFVHLDIVYPQNPEEQRRIAEALSDVDKLIRELDTLIEKKRSIMQGAMQDLLTARRRLPGFSQPWCQTQLKRLVSMNSGGTPSTAESSYYGGNIPFLSISDITSSGKFLKYTTKSITQLALENTSARLFRKGTLVLSMYASIGKVCFVDTEVAISQAILGFCPIESNLDINFLYYMLLFSKEDLANSGQTGTQSNLNKNIVQNYTISLPHTKEEQTAIASILSDMDAEIEELEAKRDKYIAVRQGMMQQLLTGKIRLI